MDVFGVLVVLVCCILSENLTLSITSTGGYSTVNSGTIQTPNHPSNYAPNLNRIWVLEAPTQQGVELELGPVSGEIDGNGACIDYVEVRDGSSKSAVLFKSCQSNTNTTVASTSRWLWVRFYANWETQAAGFSATWTHYERNDNETEISPRRDCKGNEIRCPNTECVTTSWRCDNFNDCGYDGDGSDEDWWCFTQPMSTEMKYAYGVSIGVVVFVLLILLIGWLDGRFASAGRCGRGPKSCLGLDRLRDGPRTRRLPSYAGQTPAMLLLTGQHDKFEELAAKEWEKKTDAYKRRASAIDLQDEELDKELGTPIPQSPQLTKPASVQRKGQQQLQRMKSAREQVPEVPIPRDVKRKERPKPWVEQKQTNKKADEKTDNKKKADEKIDNKKKADEKIDNKNKSDEKTDNTKTVTVAEKKENATKADEKSDNKKKANEKTDNKKTADEKTDNTKKGDEKTDNSQKAEAKTDDKSEDKQADKKTPIKKT